MHAALETSTSDGGRPGRFGRSQPGSTCCTAPGFRSRPADLPEDPGLLWWKKQQRREALETATWLALKITARPCVSWRPFHPPERFGALGSRVQQPRRESGVRETCFFLSCLSLFVPSFSSSAHRRTILSESGIGKESPWRTWQAGGAIQSRGQQRYAGAQWDGQGISGVGGRDMRPPITSRGFGLGEASEHCNGMRRAGR